MEDSKKQEKWEVPFIVYMALLLGITVFRPWALSWNHFFQGSFNLKPFTEYVRLLEKGGAFAGAVSVFGQYCGVYAFWHVSGVPKARMEAWAFCFFQGYMRLVSLESHPQKMRWRICGRGNTTGLFQSTVRALTVHILQSRSIRRRKSR